MFVSKPSLSLSFFSKPSPLDVPFVLFICRFLQLGENMGKQASPHFQPGKGYNFLHNVQASPPSDSATPPHSKEKSSGDDERLIGYLRAISAKSVVQSLKENEKEAGGVWKKDGVLSSVWVGWWYIWGPTVQPCKCPGKIDGPSWNPLWTSGFGRTQVV